MDIEAQEKLEIQAIEILKQLAAECDIEYGEFVFSIHEGKIDNWKLAKHRRTGDLTKE